MLTLWFSGDDLKDKSLVNRVILVSGKHYYALKQYRDSICANNVAIVRVESLCPFPVVDIMEEIAKYKNAKSKCHIKVWLWNIKKFSKLWNFCSVYLESRGAEEYGSLEFYKATFWEFMWKTGNFIIYAWT